MRYLVTLSIVFGLLVFGYVLAQRSNNQVSVPNQTPASRAVAAENKTNSVSVHVYNRDGKLTGPVQSPKVELSAAGWRKRLSPESFDVLRNHGTETPYSGNLLEIETDGVYSCAGCGLPLFASDSKFHSGTGWPSFFQPIVKENVLEVADRSDGMQRTEIRCPRCGGHLGHVFDDGPKPTGLRYCMNSVALKFTPRKRLAQLADPAAETEETAPTSSRSNPQHSVATAVFASGCFWATEAAFDQIKGVLHAESGYSGGAKSTADYEDVTTGRTGHAEAVQVTYDPSRVSYSQLLDVFFAAHDPTELNRQGPDTGTQYRSAIFYADDQQQQAAEAKIRKLTQVKAFPEPIATAVEPLKTFYPAEAYHQNYVHNHPDERYIQTVSLPKVRHVQVEYPALIKNNE